MGTTGKILLVVVLLNLFHIQPALADTYRPLIGTNYVHLGCANCCGVAGTNIIKNYDKDGVRETVQNQLAIMKNDGIQTLRTIFWYRPAGDLMYIPIVSGKLEEPYRTNLINYLTDVKNAGYARLSFAFEGAVDIDKEMQWQFLADVRSLVKQYGPANTRISLDNEGAPSINQPNYQETYDTVLFLYKRYVASFGKRDVIAAGVIGDTKNEGGNRLQNLINLYKESGFGMPMWFEIHSYGTYDETLADLNLLDGVLNQNGLSQPLVLGETFYNSPDVARALKQFTLTHTRQLDEIIQWPLKNGVRCTEIPPYSVSEFLSEFPILYPTPSKPGDFNSDGKVDSSDYNIIKNRFSFHPYTIFDYNILVENFGK